MGPPGAGGGGGPDRNFGAARGRERGGPMVGLPPTVGDNILPQAKNWECGPFADIRDRWAHPGGANFLLRSEFVQYQIFSGVPVQATLFPRFTCVPAMRLSCLSPSGLDQGVWRDFVPDLFLLSLCQDLYLGTALFAQHKQAISTWACLRMQRKTIAFGI